MKSKHTDGRPPPTPDPTYQSFLQTQRMTARVPGPVIQASSPEQRLEEVRVVFTEQAKALIAIAERIGEEIIEAVDLILSVHGRVIITGMGKSGIVGQKIASTLSSTGTPSFFVHPGDAFHGDLGMIRSDDVVVLISYSGETEEVLKLLPYLNHIGAPMILLSGGMNSTMATHATLTLDVSVAREACPHNLAPTTSSTATLVMGDALAIALMNTRRFQPKDFAKFHPGGSLGKKLLTHVRDVMHVNYTRLKATDAFIDVMALVTKTRLGLAAVVDEQGKLLGVISDGDMIRAMQPSGRKAYSTLLARDLMTTTPITVADSAMFSEAEQLMRTAGVTSLVAISDDGMPCGIVKVFDMRG
jgi:arabinose-5-phosphate isomerase